jgi:hypothetical protein
MPSIRSLHKKDTARPEYTTHFSEDFDRIVEMLEDIVADNDVEALIFVRNVFSESFAAFVEVWIIDDARIGIDAADASRHSFERHLGNDSSAGTEIEEILCCIDFAEHSRPKQTVVPASLVGSIATFIEPGRYPAIPFHVGFSSVDCASTLSFLSFMRCIFRDNRATPPSLRIPCSR